MQNLANFAYLEEFFFKILFIYLFICWIFVATHRFSLVVVHGLSCSAACGIFPDQVSNPCLLHWQMDSLPLSHQGTSKPGNSLIEKMVIATSSFKGKDFNLSRRYSGGSVVKNLPAHTGDVDSIPGWGISPGERNGNPIWYSCLGNSMDRGAWKASVQGIAKE